MDKSASAVVGAVIRQRLRSTCSSARKRANQLYAGALAFLALYSRAITAAEVASHYAAALRVNFDVRDYGATLDGVTDDTDAIELTSLAAAPVLGTIVLPPGHRARELAAKARRSRASGAAWTSAMAVRCAGAGIGATTIELDANQPDHSASANIVINHRIGWW